MKLTGRQFAELEQLFVLMCDGDISSEQLARLEEFICGDDEARQLYLELTDVHAALGRTFVGDETVEETVDEMDAWLAEPAEPSPARWSRFGRFASAARDGLRRANAYLATPVAVSILWASITVVGVVLALATIYPFGESSENAGVEQKRNVAMLFYSPECQWADAEVPASGGEVEQGQQLRLDSGTATIAFRDGATVGLIGPAVFRTTSTNSGHLQSGALTAWAPKQAAGFAIHTNAATVVDIGTGFGVAVDDERASLVRVFRGTVDVYILNASSDERQVRRLIEGEQIRVLPSGDVRYGTPEETELAFLNRRGESGRMLFQDRFCTDVNQAFEGRSVADRATGQRGAILPEGIDYLIEGDARVEVDAEGERRGILALGERTRVSPQIPFNRTDIENAGGFAVEFAMKLRGPEHLRMTHWLGVRAFVDEENRLGDYQAGGQGLLGHFRENGHYSLYSKGVRLPPDSEPRPEFSKQREGWQRLRLEYRMNRLAIDSPVTLVGFANGAREPFVEFTTKTGFEHLHLTLEYRNFNGSKLAGEALVDWLRVSLLNRGMYGQAVP